MQFNSIDFLIFFPIVIAIYFVVPRKLRSIWLLAASYYFYMSWEAKYALLIGLSTVLTYACGLAVSRLRSKDNIAKIKYIVAICLIVNLGILGIYKYGNFAIDSVNSIFGLLHISVIDRRFDLLLPVGISFYTFQALGYIIDVYRGDVEVETNLIRYALFVSFFPQLVAGPIERSKNLLNQMRNITNINLWNLRRVSEGFILMIWGLFMKMVIADRVAIPVNAIFDNYRMYGSTELILAAVGFSIQIYCDFGSYSLIAIGAAKIMGFDLMENFNTPYFARSIKDFWSRWHISLSTWLRDYLYIPLGGNRKGKRRKCLNLMIVFLVSGLWHGANYSFVFWGGLHGLYQIIGDATSKAKSKLLTILNVDIYCFSWKLLETVVTFILVTIAWIFFRVENISDGFIYIKRIICKPTPWLMFNGGIFELGLDRVEYNVLVISIVILFGVDLIRKIKKQDISAFLFEQNLWFRWLVVILLIGFIFVYGEYGPMVDAQQFIYFQF